MLDLILKIEEKKGIEIEKSYINEANGIGYVYDGSEVRGYQVMDNKAQLVITVEDLDNEEEAQIVFQLGHIVIEAYLDWSGSIDELKSDLFDLGYCIDDVEG